MPGFNPLGSITGRTSATLFEIRLENDVIVLRGNESEAASQLLQGVVVLCLPASLKVEDVHLRMTGQLRVGWNDARVTPSGISNNRVDKSTEIFIHRWPPFVGSGSSSKGVLLPAGNYEWPFEIVIPGSIAESVEGLHDSHVVYKLKATVARGKLAYDLHAWKPVRVVRTLDPASDLEFAHAMTVENFWANKIEYQLIVPQKAVIFGTSIDIQMRFTLLLKGLKIGKIKCTLYETQEFTIPASSACGERGWKNQREIDSWNFEVNENEHYRDLLNDAGQDGFILNEALPLPKRLAKCMQDVNVHGIKIKHRVKFTVSLNNPDGHISELRATLPVFVFISPNMPISEDGVLVNQAPTCTQALDALSRAPPLYGQHILDQLYADLDQSGYITPNPQSGMNTPFSNHSRSGSFENLSSLQNAEQAGAVPPGALSSRLQNLNSISRSNSFRRARHSAIFPENSITSTPPDDSHNCLESNLTIHHRSYSSRSLNDDEHSVHFASGQHTPEHVDNPDIAELNKVPSYTTAVRTPPPPRNLSFTEAVPHYEAAIAAPPCPARRFSSPVPTIQENGEELGGLELSSMGFTRVAPVSR